MSKEMNLFVAIILLMMLSSCGNFTTVVPIDPPEFDSQMSFYTVNQEGDSSAVFFVGKNRGILETGSWEDYDLEGAYVTITNNTSGISYNPDNVMAASAFGEYLFEGIATDFFKAGDNYTYTIEHPDYPTASSTDVFPAVSNIDNIVYKFDDGIDLDGERVSSISFDVQDNMDEKNYYGLVIFKQSSEINGSALRSIGLETTDPSGLQGASEETLLFSDDAFNGEKKKITVRFSQFSYDPDDDQNLFIHWRSLNEGHYKYAVTLERYWDTQGTPFNSPVQVFSNVDDGYGVVSFFSESISAIR